MRAHLDGCVECREQLAEIMPAAAALSGVDPARIGSPATPPVNLGDVIAARVAAGQVLLEQRRRRSTLRRGALRMAAAAVAAAALIGVGVALPLGDPPPARPVPTERIALRSTVPGVQVSSAAVVPHTWGIELKLTASGLAQGGTYRATVQSRDGRTLPAGEFLGTGATPVICNLQAALLRKDARAVAVLDAAGRPVLTADLPA